MLLSRALRRKKLGLTRARERREYAEENASDIEEQKKDPIQVSSLSAQVQRVRESLCPSYAEVADSFST